jgi:hypothetical protein
LRNEENIKMLQREREETLEMKNKIILKKDTEIGTATANSAHQAQVIKNHETDSAAQKDKIVDL